MAEPAFTEAFLRCVAEVETIASPHDLQLLDRILARIVNNPYLRERFPTFYDPHYPTFLLRADPFAIEFAVGEKTDRVTFVSLFYRH